MMAVVTMRLALEAMVTIVMVLVLLEMMVLGEMVLLPLVLGVTVTMMAASAHLADGRSPLYLSQWVN